MEKKVEEEEQRGAEAFEVRKCRSLLQTQLHRLDLCRFQGSVCRPDGRQASACYVKERHPVNLSK